MMYALVKFGLSAAVLVAVSEISKRSSFFGGLLASLPLTSILAMFWLHHDTHDPDKIASLSQSIFWLVLPSLVLFILLPVFLRRGFSFYGALCSGIAGMLGAYGLMILALKKAGITL